MWKNKREGHLSPEKRCWKRSSLETGAQMWNQFPLKFDESLTNRKPLIKTKVKNFNNKVPPVLVKLCKEDRISQPLGVEGELPTHCWIAVIWALFHLHPSQPSSRTHAACYILFDIWIDFFPNKPKLTKGGKGNFSPLRSSLGFYVLLASDLRASAEAGELK